MSEETERNKILRKLESRTKIPKAELNYIWIELMDLIREEIKAGNEVYLAGLGKFIFKHRTKRWSNLQNVEIPPHKQLAFKVNQELARYIRVMTREF